MVAVPCNFFKIQFLKATIFWVFVHTLLTVPEGRGFFLLVGPLVFATQPAPAKTRNNSERYTGHRVMDRLGNRYINMQREKG